MASVSSQPQFRYSQPPSKVLHLRNCPWECTEEELIELGKPFGKVLNTKCNVGANRNQAFIEFADLNQAIAMVSYYASSSEPAQLRGKTVYIQYSNRQEIVNNRTSGDVTGNVLLVTIEGVEPRDVSIDVLHLNHNYNGNRSGRSLLNASKVEKQHHVEIDESRKDIGGVVHMHCRKFDLIMETNVFSAFGFVHKIATFEKTAGFQALVQFSDSETASAAKNSLDGRSIPRYLLPEHVNTCSLKITYSAHTDLSVKFQSHRSRDYTNPNLPVAPSAIDGSGQFAVGLDGRKQEQESNVLLASIEHMQYPVNVDILHTVFSAFGPVQKIAMFEKNAGWHALIQYPDVQMAVIAKESLEGHCIYDGGFCKLHLSYSRHTDLSVKVNNDRSRDYTIPNTAMLNTQPSILGQQPVPMVGPAAPMYGAAQFAPVADATAMAPQAVAGWGMNTGPVPQAMPHQFPNNAYMLHGATPSHPEMGPGMMHFHGPSGQPPVRPMPPYGH